MLCLCRKESAAVPPDVRKAFGLPAGKLAIWATPSESGGAPNAIERLNGSAERFRTSDGIAESVITFWKQALVRERTDR